MSDADTRTWWQLKGDERARAVHKTVDAVTLYQAGRIARTRRNLSMFEGRNLTALHPTSYLNDSDRMVAGDAPAGRDSVIANIVRSICQTAWAQICSKQQPKASFAVNTSDWSVKRRAKRAQTCVEAFNQARAGQYDDAWELYADCMADVIFGCDQGVAKFWPEFSADGEKARIRLARCLPWEVNFSVDELKHGNPQNVFHAYGYDRHVLAALFPKYREQILNAPNYSSDSNTSNDNVATMGDDAGRQVKVREAWRLPIDENTPGAHAMVVGEVDLLGGNEEWLQPNFPFLFFTWERQRIGGYSMSLVDVIYNIAQEMNLALERRSEAERLCSNLVGFYEEGAVEKDQLISNDIGIWIPLKPTPENPHPAAPTWQAPNTVAESSIDWQRMLKDLAYEIGGITQGTAQGANEPGVTAAIAMRQLANQAAARLGMPFKHYERRVAVGATRQILGVVKQIKDAGAELQILHVRGKQAKEYDFADNWVDLPDEAIQVDAVSGLVNTTADRMQLASELLDRQTISKETYLEMIQAKSAVADLDHVNEFAHWIETQIENWLDYEDGDEFRDPDDKRYFRYRPPIKFIGGPALTDMLIRVAQEYLRAEADDAPDAVLKWFERFLEDCDAIIQKLAQRDAEMTALANSKNAAPAMAAGAAPPPQGPPQ